jgi:hypothetical protein
LKVVRSTLLSITSDMARLAKPNVAAPTVGRNSSRTRKPRFGQRNVGDRRRETTYFTHEAYAAETDLASITESLFREGTSQQPAAARRSHICRAALPSPPSSCSKPTSSARTQRSKPAANSMQEESKKGRDKWLKSMRPWTHDDGQSGTEWPSRVKLRRRVMAAFLPVATDLLHHGNGGMGQRQTRKLQLLNVCSSSRIWTFARGCGEVAGEHCPQLYPRCAILYSRAAASLFDLKIILQIL